MIHRWRSRLTYVMFSKLPGWMGCAHCADGQRQDVVELTIAQRRDLRRINA